MQHMSRQGPAVVDGWANPEAALLLEGFVVQQTAPKPELTGRHLGQRQRLARLESADHPCL